MTTTNTTETTRGSYHRNALGSAMLITDGNGSSVCSYSYQPYGEQSIIRGGAPQATDPLGQHLGFTCRMVDVESGLIHNRARQYGPQQGAFTARDPLQYAAGSNLYGYGECSPANYRDPLGLSSDDPDLPPGPSAGPTTEKDKSANNPSMPANTGLPLGVGEQSSRNWNLFLYRLQFDAGRENAGAWVESLVEVDIFLYRDEEDKAPTVRHMETLEYWLVRGSGTTETDSHQIPLSRDELRDGEYCMAVIRADIRLTVGQLYDRRLGPDSPATGNYHLGTDRGYVARNSGGEEGASLDFVASSRPSHYQYSVQWNWCGSSYTDNHWSKGKCDRIKRRTPGPRRPDTPITPSSD